MMNADRPKLRRAPWLFRAQGRLAVIFAIAGLVLSACGNAQSSGDDSTPAGATNAGDASAEGEASLDQLSSDELYEQAKGEGSVVISTPINEEAMAGIAEDFNSEYPGIDVQVVTLNVDEIVARVNTEQRGGQHSVDIIVNDGFRLQQLLSIEAIEPYEPGTKPELLDGLESLDGFSSVAFVTTRSVAYNPTTLEERGIDVPTSLEDLTQPEWEGNFAVTPHSVDAYTGMIAAYGEEQGTELLESLGENTPRLVESNSQAITLVQSGDIPAALSYGTYASPAKESNPSNLDFFNTDPLLTTTYFQALATEAPNPASARLFINWFGTAEGQQAMVDEAGFTSIRSDVENDPAVWNPEQWEPAFVSLLDIDEYNEQLEKYRSAMNVP